MSEKTLAKLREFLYGFGIGATLSALILLINNIYEDSTGETLSEQELQNRIIESFLIKALSISIGGAALGINKDKDRFVKIWRRTLIAIVMINFFILVGATIE